MIKELEPKGTKGMYYTPRDGTIKDIHFQISQLRDKNWNRVHLL